MSDALPVDELKIMAPRKAARENLRGLARMRTVQQAEWMRQAWWVMQAAALPRINCLRHVEHGEARVYYDVSKMGQVLGYACPLCGWDKVMIVQEGQQAPSAPLPAPITPVRKGYNARRPKLSKGDVDDVVAQ